MLFRFVIFTLAILMVSGCGNGKDKDYVTMNTIPMKTICIGRMLVSLPEGGKIDWQQHFDFSNIKRTSRLFKHKEDFEAYIHNIKEELINPTSSNPDGRLFKYVFNGSDYAIFLYREKGIKSDTVHTDRYFWMGSHIYVFQTGALFDNQAIQMLPEIEKNFSKFHAIENSNPPPMPGFCIDSALVTGNTGPIWASVTVRNKKWKGVSISAGASEDDGSRKKLPWQQSGHATPLPTAFEDLEMFETQAAYSKASGADDRWVLFDVLRKRTRELAGLPGQEIAFKIKLANGQEYYEFEWVSTGDDDRPYKSGFNFDLAAGNKDFKPNYTPPPPEKDLLAVWDAMLDSLKPRPGGR